MPYAELRTAGITVGIECRDSGPPALVGLTARGVDVRLDHPVPAVEIMCPSLGHAMPAQLLSRTTIGSRLRYREHRAETGSGWSRLTVTSTDADGLIVDWSLFARDAVPAVTSRVRVTNSGSEDLALSQVASLSLAATGTVGDVPVLPDSLDLFTGTSDWLGENRWSRRPLRDVVADLTAPTFPPGHKSGVTWPARWAPGRRLVTFPSACWPPAARRTAWPGRSSTTGPGAGRSARRDGALPGTVRADRRRPPVDRACWPPASTSTPSRSRSPFGRGLDGAVAALTAHRRAARRPHPDHRRAAGGLQRLHEHPDGRPDHREAAAADRRGRRRRGRGVLHRRRLVRRRPGTGGTASANGSRPRPGSPAASGRCSTAIREPRHGARVCGWSRRSSGSQPGRRPSCRRGLPPAATGVRVVEHGPLPPRSAPPGRSGPPRRGRSTGSSTTSASGYFKLDYNIDPGPGTDRAAASPGAGLLRPQPGATLPGWTACWTAIPS